MGIICGIPRNTILVKLFIMGVVYLTRVFHCERGRELVGQEAHVVTWRVHSLSLWAEEAVGLSEERCRVWSDGQWVCFEPESKEP